MGSLIEARRRAILQAGLTDAGYVADGLVLHLDGWRQGDEQAKWKSLVNGHVFDLVNCVSQNDCVSFDGSSSYGICRTMPTILAESGTIEAVVELQSRGRSTDSMIYSPCGPDDNYKIGLECWFGASATAAFFADKILPGVRYDRYSYYPSDINDFSAAVSASPDGCLINGKLITERRDTSSPAGNTGDAVTIGRRIRSGNSNLMWLKGRIYALRLYSRPLNVDELAHNQKVDHKRFNLTF